MPKKSSTASGRRHWSSISERTSVEAQGALISISHGFGVAACLGGFELKEQRVEPMAEQILRTNKTASDGGSGSSGGVAQRGRSKLIPAKNTV
ncbi:MAG: hypothetical protein WAO02_01230 [Verrucomicrobiia bacterium]